MKFQIVLFITAMFISATCIAGDVNRGRELHRENCTTCHQSMQGGDGTGIYTRENRRMESFAALSKQVRRCKTSLGVSWPEHQIDDVITYLNESFYQFEVDKE